jgi:hypothetical protein
VTPWWCERRRRPRRLVVEVQVQLGPRCLDRRALRHPEERASGGVYGLPEASSLHLQSGFPRSLQVRRQLSALDVFVISVDYSF